MDVGVYDLHFTKMILKKEPIFISGVASMDTDEHHLQVDEQAAWIAQYDKGELGLMCSSIRTDMIDTAYIYGTKRTYGDPTVLETMAVTTDSGRQDRGHRKTSTTEDCRHRR